MSGYPFSARKLGTDFAELAQENIDKEGGEMEEDLRELVSIVKELVRLVQPDPFAIHRGHDETSIRAAFSAMEARLVELERRLTPRTGTPRGPAGAGEEESLPAGH